MFHKILVHKGVLKLFLQIKIQENKVKLIEIVFNYKINFSKYYKRETTFKQNS